MLRPKHIALTTQGSEYWAKMHGKGSGEACKAKLDRIMSFVKLQIKENIPLLTVHLFSSSIKKAPDYSTIMECYSQFFSRLLSEKIIFEEQIKISVFGKWYDLPGNVVDSIRKMIEETKDFDKTFLNFCVNYDGQEEIVDACKLVARKIMANKLDVENITADEIRDNLYSSYFLPPDMIVITGKRNMLQGFMLWDSVKSRIFFVNKPWQEFTTKNLMDLIKKV